MSMEDILNVLVNSRQQGAAPSSGSDPMTDLLGGLLGSTPTQGSSNQQAGLSNMMGMLETLMGGSQPGSTNQMAAGNDPLMMLLQPFVTQLAKKMNIPPEIAMIVVSLVAHKLLAHHPSSGRDSNSFNLDDMLTQMGSGNIDSSILNQSGMIKEVTQRTGMNEADAEKAVSTALTMFGKNLGGGAVNTAKTSGAVTAGKKGLKSSGIAGKKSPK